MTTAVRKPVSPTGAISATTGVIILLVIAIGGLFYVKWLPYYHRAFLAQANHSIGRSILTAGAEQPPAASLQAAIDYALAYGKAIWQAMLVGLLLGSALQEFAPRAQIRRLLGSGGWRGIASGALLSIPGMMCTCCAAPVVIGLRRQHASTSSAMAFWLGNTVLNPATLVFMGFVLGWQWTALRLLFGIAMVFGVAWLVGRVAPQGDRSGEQLGDRFPEQLQRAASAQGAASPQDFRPSLKGWLLRFLRLAVGLIPEYVLLVLLLGATRVWLFPHIGPNVDNTMLWILAMAAAGLLFVIPTAGEVPIVQTMLALGIGVGPAAALLLTLPPVSLPSLAMTKAVFSYRVLALVAAAVLLIGILAGFTAIALGFHA